MPAVLDEEEDTSRADVSGEIRLPATLEGAGPLPGQAEVVIVGGGVIGLAIAYNLARRGLEDVVVVERGYLAEGASGRNGGGVRQQWSTEINIRLMQESVDLCRRFAVDLGVNVWFRQGGYLFLARSAQRGRAAREEHRDPEPLRRGDPDARARQGARHRARARPRPASSPRRTTRPTASCSRGRSCGATRARPRRTACGSSPRPRSAGWSRGKGGGYLVHTPRGTVRARRLVNATGAWSPKLAQMIGVDVPTYPIRHEICSSEPLKPFLRPMVSELASGLYCSQSMRGEIVGGVTHPRPRLDLRRWARRSSSSRPTRAGWSG